MFEILGLLADGFVVVFEPQNLMLIIAGCTLGLFIGAMPGLGSVNGVRRHVRRRDFVDHARHTGRFDRGRDHL
jgi:hypothetical protein